MRFSPRHQSDNTQHQPFFYRTIKLCVVLRVELFHFLHVYFRWVMLTFFHLGKDQCTLAQVIRARGASLKQNKMSKY